MERNTVVRLPQMLGNFARYQAYRRLLHQEPENIQPYRRRECLQANYHSIPLFCGIHKSTHELSWKY
ncbi:hypothetical protein, partial [Acidithiobacillus sp.]|uniref:hypothetical protein n=1 Tax=Acidithiobacillus sp. TaxID=1872118 RepID=UPI00230D4501